MVSKTATLVLLTHTITTLFGLLFTQSVLHNITTDIPRLYMFYTTFIVQLLLNTPLFLIFSLITHYLLPSRLTRKHHLLTTILLSPLLAHTLGHLTGHLATPSQENIHATACWEQISLKDPAALRKAAYCTRKYGMSREEAGRGIGGIRYRYDYANVLGTVCIGGRFLDWELVGAGAGGVCWMGARREGKEEEEEEARVREEGRNSKRMWMRRVYEECYARAGIDMKVYFKKGEAIPEMIVRFEKDDGFWLEDTTIKIDLGSDVGWCLL